jgi:hypothetical protein
MIQGMPRPRNERKALEEERGEIPGLVAAYRQELENGRPHKARRERLDWQIREREKRLAAIEARLAHEQRLHIRRTLTSAEVSRRRS